MSSNTDYPIKIYTSYFAKVKKIPEWIKPVSIAAKTPDSNMQAYKKLAPPWYVLKAYKDNADQNKYVSEYKRLILDHLDPKKVVDDIVYMTQSHEFVLLCYEKSGDFCHRNLVADWLRKAGYDVEEWSENNA